MSYSLAPLRSLFVALGFVLLITGCQKDKDDPTNDLFATYDRRAMLTRLRDTAVVPAYEELAQYATQLHAAIDLLGANPTSADLERAQDAWLEAARAWKRTDVFAFGPAETLNLRSGIGAEADPVTIENAIAATPPIDQAFVDTRPTTAKGVWALEYLLFERDGGNQAVLTRLTTGPAAPRRRAYLTAIATDLRARTEATSTAWRSGPDRAQFVEADGNDVTSSLSLLVNASVQTIETIKNDRLGRPLGDENGGTAQPASAEGYRSGTSGQLIRASLDGIRAVWPGTSNQPGLNGLLDHLGAQSAGGQALSGAINGRLDAAYTRATGDVVSLVGQERQPVLDLQVDVKMLTVLLKTEAVSKLGVLLTFNDNDGD